MEEQRQQNTMWYFITSIGMLFVVVVVLVLLFMHRNSERIAEQNQQYLIDSGIQSVKSMEALFDSASQSIEMVSRLYELQLDEPKFDHRLLDTMAEKTPFDHLRFVGLDGVSWAGDGTQIDCRDREYYLEGIQGRSGTCYIEASRFTNGKILVFYTPLYYEGRVIGVMNGVLSAARMAVQLESRFFGKSAMCYVLLRDGTVVAAYGQSELSGNAVEAMRLAGIMGERELYDLDRALKTGSVFSCRYSSSTGVGSAYLTPLRDEDFMLLLTFPSSAGRAITDRANQEALWLEVALIAAFVVYIGIVLVYAIARNSKLAGEKEDLSQIVDSVKQLYRRFVVFDLDEDTYEYLKEGDIASLGLPARGSYGNWLSTFRAQHNADPRYWSSMEEMAPERLRERITRENWFEHRDYPVPGGRWERMSLIKLDRDADRTSRVLGAVEDITELKKRDEESRLALEQAYEAADRANHAKSDFLSQMSHDIRTPMNAIIGLTAIARRRSDDRAEVDDCLEKIARSSDHLLRLINEVLDMSKIESREFAMNEAPFSMAETVRLAEDNVRPSAEGHGVELAVQMGEFQHPYVIGDALRVQEVLLNFLSNAVKYTPSGGHVSMVVEEEQETRGGGVCFQFVVEDDGIGMSEEFQKKLFKPFERAEDARISKIQGTGLGMSIAQNLVKMMNGTIQVESALDVGTRFTVTLFFRPAAHAEIPEPVPAEDAEELEGAIEGSPEVLLVEDNDLNREIARTVLEMAGVRVDEAVDGRDAVNRFRESEPGRYRMILMDIQMPLLDGYGASREIRALDRPDAAAVPIIALTANSFPDDAAKAREAGMNAHLAKPLEPKSLIRTLRQWLK